MSADLRGVNTLMLDFFDDPGFVRDLFEFTIEMELRFARAQIDAGADMIGVGDAAASLIGPQLYFDFVQPYEQSAGRARFRRRARRCACTSAARRASCIAGWPPPAPK